MSVYPSATTVLDTAVLAKPSVGGPQVYVIDKTFDLTEVALLTGTDSVNLMAIPANHMVLAAFLECSTIGTVASGTVTGTLKVASTSISAATNMLAVDVGSSTTIAPVTVGEADTYVNLVMAVQTGTMTLNPIVKVRIVGCDMNPS